GLGIDLPLRSLFETTTLAEQALLVEAALRNAKQVQRPPLVPLARTQTLPLSFAQQRLWFLDQLHPGDAAQNIPLAMRLTGPLDLDALTWSLQEIVRRHESLRTTFQTIDGEAVQTIAPLSDDFTLLLQDLSGMQGRQQQSRLQEIIQHEATCPFSLALDCLLRTTLVRLGAQEHVFLLTMHHIISDGWSIGVLFYELQSLYQARTHHLPSPLPALAIQYADFASWQRQWLQGEVLETHLAYWKQRLAGAHSLDYPLD